MPRLQDFFAALVCLPSLAHAVVPVSPVPPNGKGAGFIGNAEFISDLGDHSRQPPGDWLTQTMCYCHSHTEAEDRSQYEKAAIFRYEYYNYHTNATFFLDHMCLSPAQGDQCNIPSVGGDNNDWYTDAKQGFRCKKFARTEEEKIRQANSKRKTRRWKRFMPHLPTSPTCYTECDMGPFAPDPDEKAHHPMQDKVCIGVGMSFYGKRDMEIKFNRQFRKMKKVKDMPDPLPLLAPQGRVKTGDAEVQPICTDMCKKHFDMPVHMRLDDYEADGGSRQYTFTYVDDMCDNCK